MKLKLIIFSIFLLADRANAKTPPTKDSLSIKLNKIELLFQQMYRKNDSLSRELQFYKIKEDYFANAVDRQASHFEFLMAFVLAAASLISWAIFYDAIKKQRNLLEKQIETSQNTLTTQLTTFVRNNESSLQKINDIIKSLGLDIALSDLNNAYSNLNDGAPILALDQIFSGVNKLVKIHVYLKNLGEKGSIQDIVQYIGHAEIFLKQCMKNIKDPSKNEQEIKLANAVLTDNPLKSALDLNEPEINNAAIAFQISYGKYQSLLKD